MSTSGISAAGIAGTINPDLFRFSGGTSSYPSPLYRFIHTFIPGNLLELFAWCEFIYNNSPQLATSIRRFAEYPITDLVYPKEEKLTKHYKQYFYDQNLKEFLINCGIDFHVYGNVFVSPYFPFVRMLKCSNPQCKGEFNALHVKYEFKPEKTEFILYCPSCKRKAPAKVKDVKIKNSKKLKWIRWNPKDMGIEYNEISGESRYHLSIPKNIQDGVRKKNLHIINSTPYGILKAVELKKRYCFSDNAIYHMAAHSPAGFTQGWGYPILTQALYEVIHIAILKRANEAIAWEHIVPRMVLSPAPSGSGADPLQHMNLPKWKDELKRAKTAWNKDPNYIMYAPFPVNVSRIGGDGRALMVSAEIEAAEKNLAMALGIPLEFAAGTLAWQTSAMSLRLLKNQMHTMVSKMERMVQWMIKGISGYVGWDEVQVSFEPFELSDDEQRRNLLLNLNLQNKISDSTFFSSLGLDFNEELEKMNDEQLKKNKAEAENQQRLVEEQQSITRKAKQEELAQSGGSDQMSDTEVLFQQAQQLAQMLLTQSDQGRGKVLEELKQKNYMLHALVSTLIKDHQASMRTQESEVAMQTAQTQISSPQTPQETG